MTGLSFDLTEEQEQLRQAVRDLMISPQGLSVPALLDAVPRYVRFVTEWPMPGAKIQKGRLRQRIADELAAASVTEAPRMSRPAAQADSA